MKKSVTRPRDGLVAPLERGSARGSGASEMGQMPHLPMALGAGPSLVADSKNLPRASTIMRNPNICSVR